MTEKFPEPYGGFPAPYDRDRLWQYTSDVLSRILKAKPGLLDEIRGLPAFSFHLPTPEVQDKDSLFDSWESGPGFGSMEFDTASEPSLPEMTDPYLEEVVEEYDGYPTAARYAEAVAEQLLGEILDELSEEGITLAELDSGQRSDLVDIVLSCVWDELESA